MAPLGLIRVSNCRSGRNNSFTVFTGLKVAIGNSTTGIEVVWSGKVLKE